MIALSELTEVKLDGTGVFDALMRAAKLHLEDQYAKGTIRGPEYATVYLGQLESSMQTGLAFLTQSRRIDLEAQLLGVQIQLANVELIKANLAVDLAREQIITAAVERQLVEAQVTKIQAEILNIPKQGALMDAQVLVAEQEVINSEVQNRVLEAQVCKLQAEFDLTKQTVLKTVGETELIAQKVATEKAQTIGLGVDEDSVVGRQKRLYAAQTTGFQRDAEQKAAGLYVEVWKTLRMTDNEWQANTTQGLDDVTFGGVMQRLREGIRT